MVRESTKRGARSLGKGRQDAKLAPVFVLSRTRVRSGSDRTTPSRKRSFLTRPHVRTCSSGPRRLKTLSRNNALVLGIADEF